MKKIISLFLSVLMIYSLFSIAYAKEDTRDIPWVLVHGTNGYGEDSDKENDEPYWGKNEHELLPYLRNEGYKVYAPTVGPFSSSWDRACELYAKLTGTVVDYGEAHSKKYGHNRYGRDYSGNPIMESTWDMKSKLNLIGYSLGGPTIRIFISLLTYGDKDEIAVSGDNVSPLFKGGFGSSINAAVTFSSPHNGTQLADFLLNTKIVPFLAALVAIFAKNKINDSFMLDHFNIVNDSVFPSLKNLKNFSEEDNCGTDISLQGAKQITEKYKLPETILYLSYSASDTKAGVFGHQIGNVYKGTYPLTSGLVSLAAGLKYNNVKPGKEWEENDGLVPTISAKYPFNDTLGHIEYDGQSSLERGIWYVMPTIKGTHSYYTGAFGGTDDYFDFFDNLFSLVSNN